MRLRYTANDVIAKYTSKGKKLKLPFRYLASTTLLMLLFNSNSSVADNNHYRWLDNRGEPVYSDRPPPQGIDYEVISAGSSLKRIVSAEEGAVPPETEPRMGNDFDQVDTAVAKRSKKNPELCQRAKTNLEALTTSAQVKVRNNQGEVRLLSPEEMAIEQQTAKAQISVYCE